MVNLNEGYLRHCLNVSLDAAKEVLTAKISDFGGNEDHAVNEFFRVFGCVECLLNVMQYDLPSAADLHPNDFIVAMLSLGSQVMGRDDEWKVFKE